MKNLLNNENLKIVNNRDKIESILNQFAASYKYQHKYIGDDWGYIKFNGISGFQIEKNFKMTVSGFGFNRHPNAILKPHPGCGDIGIVTVNDIKEAVNLLAQYDNIFPL